MNKNFLLLLRTGLVMTSLHGISVPHGSNKGLPLKKSGSPGMFTAGFPGSSFIILNVYLLLKAAHLLDRLDSECQSSSAGNTSHQARIIVCEEGTGHIAGDIQTFDRISVSVKSLCLLVDGDTLLSCQQRCAKPQSVERSCLDGGITRSLTLTG